MDRPERHPHPTYPKLYVFKQAKSRFWNMELCINGKKKRKSLKTDRLATAFTLAADEWKASQRSLLAEDKKRKFDRLSSNPTIGELFISWKATLPPAKRPYHETKWGAVGPFWRAVVIADITPQIFRDYFLQRRRVETQYGEPPGNGTLHKDIILLRLILNHAVEEGHIEQLPIIPNPGEILPNPRPWLSRQEWDHLCRVSTKRVEEAVNPHIQRQRIELDDQMKWMVGTMMRVGEMLDVRYRDCRVEKNKKRQPILICQVQGKRGGRTVIGRTTAARIFQERVEDSASLDDLIFPIHHRDAFTELLKAADLHVDKRTKFERNFKSLRATAISFEILRGAPSPNLLMIARNAGTSVAMIDQFYARRLSAEMGKEVLTAKQDDD